MIGYHYGFYEMLKAWFQEHGESVKIDYEIKPGEPFDVQAAKDAMWKLIRDRFSIENKAEEMQKESVGSTAKTSTPTKFGFCITVTFIAGFMLGIADSLETEMDANPTKLA